MPCIIVFHKILFLFTLEVRSVSLLYVPIWTDQTNKIDDIDSATMHIASLWYPHVHLLHRMRLLNTDLALIRVEFAYADLIVYAGLRIVVGFDNTCYNDGHISLRWRHNECNCGLSIVYSTVCSGTDQRRHQSSVTVALWGEFTGDRWIPRTSPVNYPQKDHWRGNVYLWWRHHACFGCACKWTLPFVLRGYIKQLIILFLKLDHIHTRRNHMTTALSLEY